ncbi:unnamed protein product [Rotaria magnacalcarata]|uniref:Homeobox domain-containing protein n=2 Tax=Rotaria magnacalcarata TaxID=392030 RepID=A0A818Y3D6_9BILA|nr:unnamed protein product [Rotaria magnacalcarata]CAF2267128.1 unnamed protein product [Rotaria magnacalcarata]CAF3748001.1 unnamed protein product [Rotaria magnacalcarata]CAF3788892.1 unnamed protein product [Rotaria magnacalcarata]
MMQQHITNDFPFPPYSNNHSNRFIQENYNGDVSLTQSSNTDYEQNENDNEPISMPIMYKKRVRTKFNPEQLNVLECAFERHRYPTVDIIDDLVEQLNLPTQKITIWFQNRRARLKKYQQKLDVQYSLDKDDHKQYDSGIHLDDNISHDSSTSPPINSILHLPPPPPPSSSSSSLPPLFIPTPSPYYMPDSHHSFYASMWPNFRYPMPPHSFQSTLTDAANIPYNGMNYNSTEMYSPFVFQNVSNYQHAREFNEEL